MMKNRPLRIALLCALAFAFCVASNAQQNESKKHRAVRITGKVTVFVAKATAKAAYEMAKFAGKHVVVPAVKNVAVPLAKAAPPLAEKAAKLTAKGVKNAVKALSRDRDEDQTSSASN